MLTTTSRHAPLPAAFRDLVARVAEQDMEFHSPLPTARHYVENLLAAFSSAVSTTDTASLSYFIKHVSVRIHGRDHVSVPFTPDDIIEQFSPAGHSALVTIQNLSVGYSEKGLAYACIYQTWDANNPIPLSVGTLQGRLKAGPQVWKWTNHDIQRLT